MADELASESTADVPTVVLSYLAMLAYISVALPSPHVSPPDGAPPRAGRGVGAAWRRLCRRRTGGRRSGTAASGAPVGDSPRAIAGDAEGPGAPPIVEARESSRGRVDPDDSGWWASAMRLALGVYRLGLAALVEAGAWLTGRLRLLPGIGGVLVVAASVSSALGLCGWLGVPVSLIALEVTPFLALAIGVDNMFIISEEFARQDPLLPPAQRCSLALELAGPSITQAALAETLAFLAGALSPMPAVRTFAIISAVTIAVNFALQVSSRTSQSPAHSAHRSSQLALSIDPHPAIHSQITAFVSLLVLDVAIRENPGACWPFPGGPTGSLTLAAQISTPVTPGTPGTPGSGPRARASTDTPADRQAPFGSIASAEGRLSRADRAAHQARLEVVLGDITGSRKGTVWLFMTKVLAPALAQPRTLAVVGCAFLGATLLSLSALPEISIGLDQSIALVRSLLNKA